MDMKEKKISVLYSSYDNINKNQTKSGTTEQQVCVSVNYVARTDMRFKHCR